MMVPLEKIAPKMENREQFDDVGDSSEGEEFSEEEDEPPNGDPPAYYSDSVNKMVHTACDELIPTF